MPTNGYPSNYNSNYGSSYSYGTHQYDTSNCVHRSPRPNQSYGSNQNYGYSNGQGYEPRPQSIRDVQPQYNTDRNAMNYK